MIMVNVKQPSIHPATTGTLVHYGFMGRYVLPYTGAISQAERQRPFQWIVVNSKPLVKISTKKSRSFESGFDFTSVKILTKVLPVPVVVLS
jgi:hypothetical protein